MGDIGCTKSIKPRGFRVTSKLASEYIRTLLDELLSDSWTMYFCSNTLGVHVLDRGGNWSRCDSIDGIEC